MPFIQPTRFSIGAKSQKVSFGFAIMFLSDYILLPIIRSLLDHKAEIASAMFVKMAELLWSYILDFS